MGNITTKNKNKHMVLSKKASLKKQESITYYSNKYTNIRYNSILNTALPNKKITERNKYITTK